MNQSDLGELFHLDLFYIVNRLIYQSSEPYGCKTVARLLQARTATFLNNTIILSKTISDIYVHTFYQSQQTNEQST